MKQTVWKFPLKTVDTQKVNVPSGAKPLCVGTQGEGVFLWCLVDPKQTEKVNLRVAIVGTGHERSDLIGEYLNTFMLYGESLVFHVFVAEG